MSLSCGGRGPCCHVGYAHRHCEHCDMVIAVNVGPHSHGWSGWYPYGAGYPWYGATYSGSNLLSGVYSSGLASQINHMQALQSATEVPIDNAGQ
jgi:hypothetical protein